MRLIMYNIIILVTLFIIFYSVIVMMKRHILNTEKKIKRFQLNPLPKMRHISKIPATYVDTQGRSYHLLNAVDFPDINEEVQMELGPKVKIYAIKAYKIDSFPDIMPNSKLDTELFLFKNKSIKVDNLQFLKLLYNDITKGYKTGILCVSETG